MENKVLIECLRSQAKTLRTQAELLDNLANAIENKKTDTTNNVDMTQLQANKAFDLPYSLNVDDIAMFMAIGRSKAYELMHSKGFPKIQIGRRMIVPRDAFFRWLESQTGNSI